MRLTMLTALAAVTPAVAFAGPVIDFNNAPQRDIFGPTYSEKGFTLTGSGFAFPQIPEFAYTTFRNDGSLTLNYKGPTYTLTKNNGAAFTLTSIDLGNVNGNLNGGTLRIAYDGGAPVAYAIPKDDGLSMLTLPGIRATSVAFSYLPGEDANNTLNSYARLANLAASVPEPAIWARLRGGRGVTGAALRRRRATTPATA